MFGMKICRSDVNYVKKKKSFHDRVKIWILIWKFMDFGGKNTNLFFDIKNTEFLIRKLQIWFRFEKWWVFNEKIANLKPLVTYNHRSKTVMNNPKSTCSSIWINQSLYSNHGIKIQKKEYHARDWHLHANMGFTIKHTCY